MLWGPLWPPWWVSPPPWGNWVVPSESPTFPQALPSPTRGRGGQEGTEGLWGRAGWGPAPIP